MSTRTTRSRAAKATSDPTAKAKRATANAATAPAAKKAKTGNAKAKAAAVKQEEAEEAEEEESKEDVEEQASPPPKTSRKRKRAGVVKKEAKDEEEEDVKLEADVESDTDLPHNLSTKPTSTSTPTPPPKTKPRAKKPVAPTKADLSAGAELASKIAPSATDAPAAAKKAARAKANPYGLSPGESPYPNYPHPTPEECHEVNRILTEAHGRVSQPKTIPTPSLDSSGCGEVPSVLDALIRTRLSAATNNENSSRAFRGLVQRFGLLQSGVGKGSVDWNKVRLADQKDVFEAIKSGGLADVKSKDIKKILDMVYAENQARRDALKSEGDAGDVKVEGGEAEAPTEKDAEIRKAEQDVISLDHLHLLPSDAAFNKLIEYPGIGPKTASCVLLFCLQRPSFAVDTHVFRLTKWLGWVPPDKATRNSTYAHLDIKIPDELKYPLHYLLIKHGKACGWCSAKAGAKDRVGKCPLAHLIKRGGAKGGGGGGGGAGRKKAAKGKGRGKKVDEEDEEEAESSGLSDVDSEDSAKPREWHGTDEDEGGESEEDEDEDEED